MSKETAIRPKHRKLFVESLEDRSLMAALAGGLDLNKLLWASDRSPLAVSSGYVGTGGTRSTTAGAALLRDDAYENNDTISTASNLGPLSGSKTITGLVMADSNDWYRFSTATAPRSGDSVSISFQNSLGDLDLALYNIYGQRIRYSGTTNNSEQVSLAGLSAGTYYIRVYGYLGATNPSYSLSINLGRPLTDDAFEDNDTFSTARNLGTLSSATTISNLVMADGHDWYHFNMSGSGTSSNFVAVSSSSTQGDLDMELYNASGTRLGISQSPANNEQISLAGQAAGTYYVHVYGYAGSIVPSYSLQISPGTTTTTTPPPSGGFDIQFRFSGLTSGEQTVFQQAAAKWESIITGDLPSATYYGVSVDDLLIDASATYIDGTGNILGEAGPDAFRGGSGLPYHGVMQFDSADMASMLANGTLLGVIEHEMGHVLGIGTIWSDKGLLVGAATTNPIFIGPQATAVYNAIFGTTASGVPVENTGGSGTRDAHWRESILGNELMTGYVGPGTNMPISRITVGSLADLGYTVNFAAADPFISTSATSAASVGASSSTATTTARLSSPDSIILPLSDHIRRDVNAFWDSGSRYQEMSDGFISGRRSHEAAVDVLFSRWSLLPSSLMAS